MLPWKPILMLGILSPFVSLEGLNAGNNDAKTVYLNCTASVSILIPTYFDDTYVETASIYKQILFFAYIFLGVFFSDLNVQIQALNQVLDTLDHQLDNIVEEIIRIRIPGRYLVL